MIRLYGIPNCDTVKRARAWLNGQDRPHEFVDFKKSPPEEAQLRRWSEALGGVDVLVNRRGTTWRQLDDAQRAGADSTEGALALLQLKSSLIKRPVVEWPDGRVTAGFDPASWQERLG